MSQSIPKQTFLDDLRARKERNCQIVQAEFALLDRAARSAQPEPGEWCVDQCFQHLVLTFDMNLPPALNALKGRGASDPAVTFKHSWLASRRFIRRTYEPQVKAKTSPHVNPSEHFFPDVFDRFLAQKERLDGMLTEAAQADLQRRCWYLKVFPINFGDYLEQFVMHDELHINQARRALAAYRQGSAGVAS